MNTGWRNTAAAIVMTMFLYLAITGGALANSGDAVLEQYPTGSESRPLANDDTQATTLPGSNAQAGTATVVEYYPAAAEEGSAGHGSQPAAPATLPAPAAGDAAPTTAAAPATASSSASKVFMLLGSGAAATSIVASGMAIIRGKK